MEQFSKKLAALFQKTDKLKIMVILGIIGMLLIGLSQVSGKTKEKETVIAPSQSDADYCAETEAKIKQLVAAITGDKDCIVAVTLNTGTEYVYANQTTTDTDRTEDSAANKSTTKESRKDAQQYIIMKSENGTEQPLTVTEKKPEIRGVAIVTNGITPARSEKIEASIAAMLELSARRISITEKAAQ